MPTDDLERADIAAAIVRAGYDGSDDVDLLQWHPCVDQPNCFAHRGQPCACAGVPYLSDEVWAQLGPVVRAIRAEAFAAGRAQAAADLIGLIPREYAQIVAWLSRHHLGLAPGAGAVLSWLRHDMDALVASWAAAEGGGEADLSKGLKGPVWWLHRCIAEVTWYSGPRAAGTPRPESCPRCGEAADGWFEARPVGISTERDDLTGTHAGESTLLTSTGVPVPRAETEDGGTQ